MNSILNILKTKWGKLALLGIVVLTIVVFRAFRSNSSASIGNSDKTEVKAARVALDINREFNFPLRDSQNKEVSQIKFYIDKVEIRDEIIVKGKRLGAVTGRTFLVLNLRIKNEFDRSVNINTRDYLRLATNGNENDWLAAEVHNDPVEVQAISTKLTRVAFPIYESDKNFILQVGEISGNKEKVPLEISL